MEGLDWQLVHLPFAAGLLQKSDARAKPMPYLDIANDLQFDENGGTQTRYPFALLGANILGGGTIANARRLVTNDSELLLFTNTALYSWNAQLSKWALKGTHLAVKPDEEPVFITTGEQIECDRAELDGTIVYAWVDNDVVFMAASDKATGSVLLAPTPVAEESRPRLIALDTVILLFIVSGDPHLTVYAIDPADPGNAVIVGSQTVVDNPAFGACYDVVKVPGASMAIGACRRDPATSYELFTITDDLTVTTSTKARVCDGPIAVACTPDGASVEVVRTVTRDNTPDPGTRMDVEGDLVTVSSLADTAHINKALGTSNNEDVRQATAAFRTVADSGQFRCYAFWHSKEPNVTPGVPWRSESNWVDTGGNLGTAGLFKMRLGIASHAFDHGGRVYLHLSYAELSETATPASAGQFGFGSALQNTYFLYRDDGFLVAKFAPGRAGGHASVEGHLPGVVLTDGSTTYSWCGAERRLVPTEFDKQYADRGPLDISFTFDSNEARRCVRFGSTLYITGGEVLQYDGVQLVEVGFHTFPNYIAASEDAGGPTGAVEAGDYAYKPSFRTQNARGEIDRSTTSVIVSAAGDGTPGNIDIGGIPPLVATHKTGVNVELWRTAKDPTDDVPFFIITSQDPTDLGDDENGYLVSDPTDEEVASTFDLLADADVTKNASHPEQGAMLAYFAPPAATLIAASADRIFLAGVPGDLDRVMYSRLRRDGEVASFHPALAVAIPNAGGAITAIHLFNETLVAFRETAMYALDGQGFSNVAGAGQNFFARQLPGDVGAVNQESVVEMPLGLMFKSRKGWCLYRAGSSVEYIGAPVRDYDDEEVLAIHVMEGQHQVRILTSSRMLVWNYPATSEEGRGQWAEWTIEGGLDACIWNGAHVYLATDGPLVQQSTYEDLTYGIDLETTWIKLADLQGAVRLNKLLVLGELCSSDLTHVRVQIAYDYVETYVDDKYWPVSPTTVGAKLQFKHGPKRQQCQAFKLRLTAIRRHVTFVDDVEVTLNDPPTGEALKLTSLGIRFGARKDLYNRLPAAQRS